MLLSRERNRENEKKPASISYAHETDPERDEDKSPCITDNACCMPNHERTHSKMPYVDACECECVAFLSMLFDKWHLITQHKNTSSKRIELKIDEHKKNERSRAAAKLPKK